MSRKKSTEDSPMNYIRSELNLFDKEGYDMSITSTQVNDLFPIAPLSEEMAPLTFNIVSSMDHYIDLSRTRLYLRMSVTKGDGSPMAATDICPPVNNICHSAFSQCAVYLNNTQISPTSQLYAYRAYLERLLCTSKEFNKTQAALSGYYKETDPTENDQTKDDSYKKRFDMSTTSGQFEVLGRLHSDIFCAGSFLPPGVDLKIALTRAPSAFCLHSKAAGAFKLNIHEAKLQVTRHKIQPQVSLEHIRKWEHGKPATIEMNRVDIKSYGLATGTVTSVNENLISGMLPSRIVVALVKSTNVIGTITTNPFLFGGYNLTKIGMYVNSDTNESRELDVNIKMPAGRIKEAVHNIYRSLGIDNQDCAIDFTEQDFVNNRALFVYDIDPAGPGTSPPRYGNIKIELKFSAATSDPLTVLVYTETPSILNIDQEKNAYFSDTA